MTSKDLTILDDLLDRTENLPDILYLRAAEIGYKLTENDKALLLDTYQKLDDILKEVAAFINIKFPNCERHVRAWNKIDFDTKIGDIKIITTDREHIKREWKKGMFDLKSLIKILKNEAVLLIDENEGKQLKIENNKSFQGNIIYNENSNRGKQNISDGNEKEKKKSWIEIASWIAGIIGMLIALYTILI
ncbi:hypothetical protein ACGE0T_11155 [Parabacteroides sp. APC149_11_2_Y6]